MNCARTQAWLGAELDGQRLGWRRPLLDWHLRRCPACAAARTELQQLRDRLRNELPRHAMAPALRARLLATLAAAGTPATTSPPVLQANTPRASATMAPAVPAPWRWMAGGVIAGSLATLLAVQAIPPWLEGLRGAELLAQAVDRHVDATLAGAAVQVASSDQHTVKPWLSARLDYSPPVRDLADAGFPLVGGRLDHLQGRPVATLVYRYRLHWIDVYVRPEPFVLPIPAPSRRGFQLAQSHGQGMDFLAVSDASGPVLDDLVARLAAPQAPAAP